MTIVMQGYQLIPSRNVDDQLILEYDRMRGTPDHTQTRKVVLDVTFPRYYLPFH